MSHTLEMIAANRLRNWGFPDEAETITALQTEIERLRKEVEALRANNAQLAATNDGLQDFLDRAFVAHPNLDLDIDAAMKAGEV